MTLGGALCCRHVTRVDGRSDFVGRSSRDRRCALSSDTSRLSVHGSASAACVVGALVRMIFPDTRSATAEVSRILTEFNIEIILSGHQSPSTDGSSDTFVCVVLWIRAHLNDSSFTVADRRVWNLLTASLCLLNTYTRFERLLKAHLSD